MTDEAFIALLNTIHMDIVPDADQLLAALRDRGLSLIVIDHDRVRQLSSSR